MEEPMLKGLGYENLLEYIRALGYNQLATKLEKEIWYHRLQEGRKIR